MEIENKINDIDTSFKLQCFREIQHEHFDAKDDPYNTLGTCASSTLKQMLDVINCLEKELIKQQELNNK